MIPAPSDVAERLLLFLLPAGMVAAVLLIWRLYEWWQLARNLHAGARHSVRTWAEWRGASPHRKAGTLIAEAVGVWLYCFGCLIFYISWAAAGGGGSDFGAHGMDKFVKLAADGIAHPVGVSIVLPLMVGYAAGVILGALLFSRSEGNGWVVLVSAPSWAVAAAAGGMFALHLIPLAGSLLSALFTRNPEPVLPVLIIEGIFFTLALGFSYLPVALVCCVDPDFSID